MPIISEEPAVIPPIPEKTFPLWWLELFRTHAPDPNGACHLTTTLKRLRRDPNTGFGEYYTGQGGEVKFENMNVFTIPTEHPDWDQAIGQVLDNIDAIRAGAGNNTFAVMEIITQTLGVIAKRSGAIK